MDEYIESKAKSPAGAISLATLTMKIDCTGDNGKKFKMSAIPDTGTTVTVVSLNVLSRHGLSPTRPSFALLCQADKITPMINNDSIKLGLAYVGARVEANCVVSEDLTDEILISWFRLKEFGVLSHKNNIPTILEHKLEWASVEQVDCSSFDVTIRYDCLQDPQSPFPNATEFERVCSELIPEGLKYHYEQTLWLQDSPYQVTIHPQRASEQIQPIVLPYSCGRGSNFLILPAIIPFCNTSLETHFKHTVAHEFGHAIIAANRELFHSLTHKGSSTVLQDSNEHAPHATCDGSVRNDIMHYTGSADPDCYGPNGRKNDAYYLNGFLTEADLQGLVMDAMFQDEDTLCGSGLGSNCTMIQPQSCLPGLLCSPDLSTIMLKNMNNYVKKHL
eukprot:maker-scaffold669_size115232-snap-gene-0.21 protein:Tk11214 transcript:maker-scaffold669_size115232-snap-gene-0.21-mRNA-1 annotation:"hypothetical protein"